MANDRRRVLVIEDDRAYAILLSVLLRAPLLEIVIMNTLGAAIEWLGSKLPVHAVVLDIHLPDATVGEVLDSIVRFKSAGTRSIVAITGMASVEGFSDHALERGASLCLRKDEPGFVEKLKAAIHPASV